MSSTAPGLSQTLKNLQAAFEGESNAAVRYAAFAAKAQQEGYARVATMFRATSRAEQIHAASHAKVITKMGGAPEAKIAEPVVGTTAENLAEAKAGEEYERDVMYPGFVREADTSGAASAIHTFRRASEAEAVHAALYGYALENLEAQRAAAVFYVCPVCGEVTDDVKMRSCPICGASSEKFEIFHS